jgi:ABC-type uncharacterized transport system YnjBCD substrate-binding protein
MWFAALVAAAILVGGCAKNQPPEVIAVKAFPDEVSAGENVDLLVTASDPEHAKLQYKWTAKDGKLSGKEDSTATWTSPEKPGKYEVKVVVTDPKGAKAEKSVEIRVLPSGSVYSGSLNAPAGQPKKQRGKASEEAPKKPTRGTRSGKTK